MGKYQTICIAMVCLLSACATTPRGKLNDTVKAAPPNDLQLAEIKTDIELYMGAQVRWGGKVLQSENLTTDEGVSLIRLEVLQRDLDERAKPIDADSSDGRFVAYIPQTVKPGKKIRSLKGHLITVVGKVGNTEVMQISETNSVTLPVLESQDYYVWHQNRRHHDNVHFDIIFGSSLFWSHHYRYIHHSTGHHLHVHGPYCRH